MSETPTTGARRALSAGFSALVAGFAGLFALEKVYSYDVWWHLAAGRWTLESGRVPDADILSFSVAGQPWVSNAWLSDVIFALLERAIGIEGLILFKALVIACAFGLMCWLMQRRGVSAPLAAAILGLVVVIARFRFMLRPEIFAFLLVALFLAVLSSERWARTRRVFVLVPLMLLWINLHGSGLLAPVLAGCLAGEHVLGWGWRRLRGADATETRPGLLSLLVLALLATFLATPAGLELPLWTFHHFTTSFAGVEEEAPLVWGAYPLYWALLIVTGLSFLAAGRRIRLFHASLFVVGAALAFSHQRWIAVAALLFAPVLGAHLQLALERLGAWRPRLRPGLKAQALALPLLAVCGVVATRATFAEGKTYQLGLGVMERRFPKRAVELLKKAGYRGNIFNTWELGGYLSWELPEAKTFIDGRCMRAQMELLARVDAMSPAELARYLAQNDVGAAVLKPLDARTRVLSSLPGFQAALLDDAGVLYLRTDWAARASIEGFRYVRLEAYDPSYLAPLARGPRATEVEVELRRALAQAPGGFKPAFMLGFFLEAQGRPEALAHYRAAARNNPGLANSHFQLGTRAARLALRHERWAEAVAFLEQSKTYRSGPEEQFLLGTALYKLGRYGEAEAALKQAIAAAPQRIMAQINLGYLYIDAKRYPEAIAAFEQARRVAPGHPAALYGLALALHESDRKDRAATLWRALVAKHPKSPLAKRARQMLGEKR